MDFKLVLFLLLATLLSVHVQTVNCRPTPQDYQIKGSQTLPIVRATGPESLAFDRYGEGPYTGVSDGRILKWLANESRWIDFATTTPYRNGCEGPQDHVYTESRCGRPLGLSFNQKTGDLYIADAYFGLLVVGPQGGLARSLATEAQGVPFRFLNDVVVDQETGMVYFTDSSTRFQRRDFAYVTLTRDNTGRLLKYDPTNNQVTVLLKNLMFPNGVALIKNSNFILVTETTNGRVLKVSLDPSKVGKFEVFANLPGGPDNIKRNQRGEFWVAVNSNNWESRYGLLVKLSQNGNILKTIKAGDGETWRYSSDAYEKNGDLWIGSVVEPRVVKLEVSN
ncbi:hypothetical protein ACH5RR_023853 [Cinchona calisaya]|uniref:Strictosidine synthase conserved region domain-containing protein n=1 Tax=Cinchona calisaya TaxID=153742 RepID=A0ABD2ZBU7_9GENT